MRIQQGESGRARGHDTAVRGLDRHGADLSLIPPMLRDQALEALRDRNAVGFLVTAGNELGLDLCGHNAPLLKRLGIFEETFVHAVTACRTSNHRRYRLVADLLRRIDRDKLRGAGGSLPGRGPFIAYRGVAGRGTARRLLGYHWTLDRKCAEWFAHRLGLVHPTVLCAEVPEEHVGFYSNDRNEQELFCILPPDTPIAKKPLRCEQLFV